MRRDVLLDFLASAMEGGSYMTNEQVLAWLSERNAVVKSEVRQIPLSEMKLWKCGEVIRHATGKFFSIEGIHVETNYGIVSTWEQPIINQPEIGFLGMITQRHDGLLHFLVQAKIEPGNINVVQLSPTLQATRSNYTRAHQGKPPLYLDYFNGRKPVEILVDQLQSEQGARFLHKRNRNIIIRIPDSERIPIGEDYVWLSLRQIKELMRHPNVVNMDTRTVISTIPYGTYSEDGISLARVLMGEGKPFSETLYSILGSRAHMDLSDIIKWITGLKFIYELRIAPKRIDDLYSWIYDGNTIRHEQGKYFSVIGVNVQIGNREVVSWDQPMVKPAQNGIIGFIMKKIGGVYHFLVQAKMECGNFDVIELAPTVQCLTGSYLKGQNEYPVPFLDVILNARADQIRYSVDQSEEGGRFFREQNRNMIVEVGDEFPVEIPTEHANYCWMTLNQLMSFVTFNNYVNIAARSVLSAILF